MTSLIFCVLELLLFTFAYITQIFLDHQGRVNRLDETESLFWCFLFWGDYGICAPGDHGV